MSAGAISLEAAIRTCKVDTAYANKVESDRFLNPELMVCPLWNGRDTAGRPVAPDSFYTKRAGCNSAEDRVVVENGVSRPQYMQYINLDASGIQGNIFGNSLGTDTSEPFENTMAFNEVGDMNNMVNYPVNYDRCMYSEDFLADGCDANVNNSTGNFGLQFNSNVASKCGYNMYEAGQALNRYQEQKQTKANLEKAENYEDTLPESTHVPHLRHHLGEHEGSHHLKHHLGEHEGPHHLKHHEGPHHLKHHEGPHHLRHHLGEHETSHVPHMKHHLDEKYEETLPETNHVPHNLKHHLGEREHEGPHHLRHPHPHMRHHGTHVPQHMNNHAMAQASENFRRQQFEQEGFRYNDFMNRAGNRENYYF